MANLDNVFPQFTKIRQKHIEQERQLSAILKQAQAETQIPVLCFYAHGYAGIATVQIFGNTARLSRWTDIGPMGHYDIKDVNKLAYELRMEGFIPIADPNAGQVLEQWAKMPKWTEGMEFIKKQFEVAK